MVGFKYSIIRIKPVGAGLIRFFTLLWLVGTGLVLTAVEGSAQSIMRQDSLADYSDKVWWIVADTSASKLKRVSNIAVTQHVIDSIAVLRAVINTQKIDTFTISGDTLFASLETDGEPAKFVLLAPYLDNTDNQQVDTFEINANLLRLSIEDDAQGFQTVNLAPYLDNTDNQKIDTFLISGDTLFNSLETDGEPGKFVLLAPYLDNTDTQLTQEQVEDFAGTMVALGTGTHTGIAVTYQDATGDMDLIIDHDAATNYLAGEHILHSGVTITAGDALSGGGDISATRTIDLDPSEMPGQAPDLADILAYEDVTDAGIHSMTLTQLQTAVDTDTQLSQEQVEDFAGALVANGTGTYTGIAVTYQDGTGDMDLIIDHDAATNFLAGEHILHSGVTITAGDALSGGGDISATRTLDLDPSEMGAQAPDLADILPYEDVTDAGIHSMTLTQLQTTIDTDTQLSQEQVEDFAGAMVTGNTETLITVTYQDGDGTTDFAVDANLSNYTNDAGFLTSETDDQKIDTFLISGDTLFASLEADGESGKFVLLAPYLDNTDTQLSQEQVEDFAGAMVTGNTETLITVTYQDGDGTTDFAVDANLSNYTNDAGFLTSETDDQKIDTFSISGDTLFASLETDGEPAKFVLLSSYLDNTDTQLTQEQVEDFAGAMVANGTGTHTGIAVTYQDATGHMDLIIDHDAATNFLAGEHILHSGVTITAGDALSGGGDISATRTIDLDPSEMPGQAPDLADILPYEDVTDAGIHSMTLTQLQTAIDTDTDTQRGVTDQANGLDITLNGNNIEITHDPSESAGQAPDLADIIIIEDVTDGGIHSATLTQLQTAIDTDANTLGPDGDKGDITVGGTGTTLTIDADAVTYAKIQNVVANNVFLGTDGGAGSIVEELTASASRTILDIVDKSIYIALGSRTTVFAVGHMIVPFEVGGEHDNVTITHATLQCVTYTTNPGVEIYLNGTGQTAAAYDGNGTEENITDFTIDKGEYIEVYVTAAGDVAGCGITLNGTKN